MKERAVDYDPPTGRVATPPQQIFLELSSRCNLACVHCSKDFGSDEGHQARDLSLGALRRVLPWIRTARFVNLNMVGESMMSPHFDEAVELCSAARGELSINTNGLLLTEKRCEALIASRFQAVTVSIDGLDSNRPLRGVSYERLRERVLMLDAAKRRAGSSLPHLAIATTLTRTNLEELLPLLGDLLPRADVHAVHLQPLVIFYEALLEENPYLHPAVERLVAEARTLAQTHGTQLTLFRSSFSQDESRAEEPPSLGPLGQMSHDLGCSDPFFEIKIRSTGEVMSCSNGRSPGLNVERHGLNEIWNGSYYRKLRRALSAGRFEGSCADCPYVFGGPQNQVQPVRPGVRHSREADYRATRLGAS